MALINDIVYWKEWTKKTGTYRLSCFPASTSVLPSALEYVEFPEHIFYEDYQPSAGYKDLPIGLPEPSEINFELDLFGFVGTFTDAGSNVHNWSDVAQMIIDRGVTPEAGETRFSFLTHRWRLYFTPKDTAIDDRVIFEGFQLPEWDDTKYQFPQFGERSLKIEVIVVDTYRTVLGDTKITGDNWLPDSVWADTAYHRQRSIITASNLIAFDTFDDPFQNRVAITPLYEPIYNTMDEDFSETLLTGNIFYKYNDIIDQINEMIAYVFYKKMRITLPATESFEQVLFGNPILDLTFYEINMNTGDLEVVKGDPLVQDDLYVLFKAISSAFIDYVDGVAFISYEYNYNIYLDGIFSEENLYDSLFKFTEGAAMRLDIEIDPATHELPHFTMRRIDTPNPSLPEIELTPTNILYEKEITRNAKGISNAVYHVGAGENDIEYYNLKQLGTVGRQPSYEIDSYIDTFAPVPEMQDNDDELRIYVAPTEDVDDFISLGKYWKPGTSRFTNLFYMWDYVSGGKGINDNDTFTFAICPCNSITYEGESYGVTNAGQYPQLYDKFLGVGDKASMVSYMKQQQAKPAYPEWWCSMLQKTFGTTSNLHLVQVTVDGSVFQMCDIGRTVHLDLDSFVPVDFPINLNIPKKGFVLSVEDYDSETDNYTINIILTNIID